VSDVALALSGITKRFGDTVALDEASFALRRGSVHALLGENGAGKTTLMRIAFGMLRPEEGTVAIDGRPVRLHGPADALTRGVGMVHQHFTNVADMTVAENVALGGRGALRLREIAVRIAAIGAETGLRLDSAATVATLPVGAQQRLEIVKALVRGARTLILDEPTAVLAPEESQELLAWLRAFASAGNSVVLITHKLVEALSVVDEVTVLRHGRTVLHRAASDVDQARLAQAMLGTELASLPPVAASPRDRVVLSADRLTIAAEDGRPRVSNATFAVRAGEIVGIAGVEGSGQHELLRAIARRLAPSGGVLEAPAEVGFVPEDRHRDAVILDFTLAENVALRGAGSRTGRMRASEWRRRAAELIDSFQISARSPDAPMASLSGGSQQRLVLARELADAPDALVVENPTRGLDVRASHLILQRLREAAARGTAVVVYSSDLDEVLAICTRLLVIHDGRVREVSRERDAAGRAMLGA
jgi:simple sugar transport system ATP-binding protein